MRFINLISLLFILLLFSSCYSRGKFGQSAELLKEATERYYQVLKWKYYDRAKQFIDLEDRSAYEDFVLRLEENLNLTNYEIKEYILSEDGNECDLKIVMTYYKYPSVSEKREVLYEKWVQRGSTWYVKPDFTSDFYQ
jgi:hypothetical protein